MRSQIFISGFISATPMKVYGQAVQRLLLFPYRCTPLYPTSNHSTLPAPFSVVFIFQEDLSLNYFMWSSEETRAYSASSLTDRLCALGRWAQTTKLGDNICIEQEGNTFALAVYT